MSKHVKYGKLALECCDLKLELRVLRSGAGWYLGTFDKEGPVSRESLEYWDTEDQADHALLYNLWTQRSHP